jgi:hypothetical protein
MCTWSKRDKMRIAIFGWGSLIWCPGSLKLATRWFRDGPMLPVEFARISKGDRLSLVLHPGSSYQPTLWAVSESEELADAQEDLHQREGTTYRSSIHHSTVGGEYSPDASTAIKGAVSAWLATHPRIDACVWTGLLSNWRKAREREFSVEDALQYLRGLPDPARAKEYIQNAPSQIQTEVRAAIRAELNWSDADLSPMLFEPAGGGPTQARIE